MKGLLLIACSLLGLLSVRELDREPHPLLIDAAADDFCDMPFRRQAPPLLQGPSRKTDYRMGKPYNDKGIA